MKKISLQSYDKVSINCSVYNFSTAGKCVVIPYQSAFSRVPSHIKTKLNFVLNHRLIKKGVNQIISPQGGASH